jgi:hypothetical protein
MSDGSKIPAHSPSVPTDHDDEGTVWDVEVLAERKMANGDSEVLVLWKPSWIAKKDLHSDCPAMRKFRDAPKARFGYATTLGMLILPVEPGTKLADDCAREQIHYAAILAGDYSNTDRKENCKLRQRARETPKLSDGVTKKTYATKHKSQRQNSSDK